MDDKETDLTDTMSFLKMLEDTTSSNKLLDTSETESPPAGPSLKDRMRAYNSGTTNTTKATLRTNHQHRSSTTDNKQYSANVSVREHPPKIDLYGKPKVFEDEKKEDDTTVPELSGEPERRPLATERRHSEIERRTLEPERRTLEPERQRRHSETERRTSEPDLGRPTNFRTKPSSISNGSLPHIGHDAGSRRPSIKSVGKLPNSFLPASNHPPLSPRLPPSYANKQSFPKTTAPVSEIGDEHGGGGCDMSSVSAEDFPPVPDDHTKAWQQERNLVNPVHDVAKPTAMLGATVTTLDATIAKLVDERVQAHVADLETKLGAQMRRFMQQVDDKVLMRIEFMEGKIQDLRATIETLESNNKGQQPNNPMQEPAPRWR
jgi:hypothetical protein